jgi:hypothetical protein
MPGLLLKAGYYPDASAFPLRGSSPRAASSLRRCSRLNPIPNSPNCPQTPVSRNDQLVVTESAYAGYPSLILPGTTVLPTGVVAIADGGYPEVFNAPVNTLDVSNSNTPGHFDPSNPVPSTPAYKFCRSSGAAIRPLLENCRGRSARRKDFNTDIL